MLRIGSHLLIAFIRVISGLTSSQLVTAIYLDSLEL
jgi:hypothetical protein